MPDRTFTVAAEFTFTVPDAATATARLALYTTGVPGLHGFRIVGVTEGSERTWDDDVTDAQRGPDRDDGRPITEAELFEGMGVDELVRSRPVPAKLGHVTEPWPR